MALEKAEPGGSPGARFQTAQASSVVQSTNNLTLCKTNRQVPVVQRRTVAMPLVVPDELAGVDHWVCWRYAKRTKPDGSVYMTKVPVNPRTGGNAAVDTPGTWTDLDTAKGYYDRHPHRVSGIGFVPAGTGIAALDLDHCVVDGVPVPWAAAIIRTMNTYTELSPSGNGVRMFVFGAKPGRRCKRGDVELYDRGDNRYLTFTGNHLPGTPLDIHHRDAELAHVYRDTFGPAEPARAGSTPPAETWTADVTEIAARAVGASNGARFLALWTGDTSAYSSPSEADLALCRKLAFWAGGDAELIDRCFRASGLMRPKWDDRHAGDGRTYGQMTIDVVLADQAEYYTPSTRVDGARAPSTEAEALQRAQEVDRLVHEHLGHTPGVCQYCGKFVFEQVPTDAGVDGRARPTFCHNPKCQQWRMEKVRRWLRTVRFGSWDNWWLTEVVDGGDYEMLRDGPLYDHDIWIAAPTPHGTVMVCSSIPLAGAVRLDGLTSAAGVMTDALFTVPDGKRPRGPKPAARRKRRGTVDQETEPAPRERKNWIRGGLGLDLVRPMDMPAVMALIEDNGGTVRKRGRGWTYHVPWDNYADVCGAVEKWLTARGERPHLGVYMGKDLDAYTQGTEYAPKSPLAVVLEADQNGNYNPAAEEYARQMAARDRVPFQKA